MPIEPLPSTGIAKILALLEVLDEQKGRDNLYRLPEDLHLGFGELLLVVKGAEMLGLVETPGTEVTLTPLGKQVLDAPPADKKARLKQQMLTLQVFQRVARLLENASNHEIDANVIREQLAVWLPQEQPRQLFTTLLNWGRYGEVFGYSSEKDRFYLLPPAQQ